MIGCRAWASEEQAKDPNYFSKWANTQAPDYLFIGCADSRVPVRPPPQLFKFLHARFDCLCEHLQSCLSPAWHGMEGLLYLMRTPHALSGHAVRSCLDWLGPDRPCVGMAILAAHRADLTGKVWTLMRCVRTCFGADQPDYEDGAGRLLHAAQRGQPGEREGPELHVLPGVRGGPPQGQARHRVRPLQLRCACYWATCRISV